MSSYFCFYVLSSYLFSVLFFVIIVLISCCYFTDWTLMILLTYPIIQNQITNQINKYNHNTITIQRYYFSILMLLHSSCCIIVVKKDNKRKYKRNKGKGTSSQNSGRERRIFLFVFLSLSHHCRSPRSRSIDNFFNYPFILPLYPLIIPLYYPFYNNITPFFLLLYIINMRVEKSGVSFTYCFELKTMILRQD